MEIGIIGLGKMGANMAERWLRGKHRVVAFDFNKDAVAKVAAKGAVAATSIENLVSQLKGPKAVWLMIPSGDPVDQTIAKLVPLLAANDTIIDGGNSNYKDTVRRGKDLATKSINYIDCGTSGGIWGLENGYALMIGGPKAAVERLNPLWETLAPSPTTGWGHVGPSGAGHFAKMIHNGIEYGMMQAFSEGFAILDAKKEFNYDLAQVAKTWQVGSVVRSWLLDLAVRALDENPELEGIKPNVADSGEGRWTVAEAIDLNIAAPVITQSLLTRIRSRDEQCMNEKMIAVLRNQFGGHAVQHK